MKRRVYLYIDDPLIPVKEPRIDPRFMSVDHLPGDRFRFRFELDKKGHDDSTGRDFDWWFEALTGSSERAASVRVIEDIYEDGAYRQSRWEGILESPQVSPNNTGLFQFDLRNATLTRTHTKREGIPEEFRWAEGGEEYRDLSAALNRITRELGGL